MKWLAAREDKGVREVIPHIAPILIPLKFFLEGIEFLQIMLPHTLRGSFVEEESINMAGIVGSLDECEMRIALFILFSIFTWISRHQGNKSWLKIQPWEQSGTKKV